MLSHTHVHVLQMLHYLIDLIGEYWAKGDRILMQKSYIHCIMCCFVMNSSQIFQNKTTLKGRYIVHVGEVCIQAMWPISQVFIL